MPGAALKRLLLGIAAVALAGCQSPPPSVYVSGSQPASAVAAIALGDNQVGEPCHFQAATAGDFGTGASRTVDLYCGYWGQPSGRVFELGDTSLGPVDAVYDRAALVALPAPMRKRYAAYLPELTGRAPQFLVTFIYDQSVIDGPPFSVEDKWVAAHYEPSFDLEIVETRDVEGGLKGVCPAKETAWLLKRL